MACGRSSPRQALREYARPRPVTVSRCSSPTGTMESRRSAPTSSGSVWFTSTGPWPVTTPSAPGRGCSRALAQACMVLDAPEGCRTSSSAVTGCSSSPACTPRHGVPRTVRAQPRDPRPPRRDGQWHPLRSAPMRFWDHDLPRCAGRAVVPGHRRRGGRRRPRGGLCRRVELPEGRWASTPWPGRHVGARPTVSTLPPEGTQRSQLVAAAGGRRAREEAVLLHHTDEAEMWAPAEISPDGTGRCSVPAAVARGREHGRCPPAARPRERRGDRGGPRGRALAQDPHWWTTRPSCAPPTTAAAASCCALAAPGGASTVEHGRGWPGPGRLDPRCRSR
ncbi:hypothetical protein QJS66_22030 [Kocuria rhizophila]|nr:hypothetical protein QJS66_22030 [Kocuria rhizophila]